MKWAGLVISLIVCVMAFKYLVWDNYRPSAITPVGAAAVFVDAAMRQDEARIREVCEPGALESALAIARVLPTLRFNRPLVWQATRPENGQGAVTAPLTGAGRMIVIEWNHPPEGYRITKIDMVEN